MSDEFKNLVSVAWLAENLNHPDLIVFDATMKKKPNGEPIEQASVYIKGAREFNFDTQICDQQTDLPHMLPKPEAFEFAVRKLGVNNNSIIVVYDAMGIFSSARAWWMFKVMGHNKVYVLDGGLPKWLELGLTTDKFLNQNVESGDFNVAFNPQMLVSAAQVLKAINKPEIQIVDARSQARFNATEPEPRVALKGGHIPGSVCLPFNQLITNGEFKNIKTLKQAFEDVVKKQPQAFIFSCGSGVTASILALAADEVGYQNLAVYDGSWSEWGASDGLPIEK